MTRTTTATYPKNLKILRWNLGVSQEQMSQAIGIAKGTYCQIETGRYPIQPNMVETIMKKFNVTYGDLFGLNGPMALKTPDCVAEVGTLPAGVVAKKLKKPITRYVNVYHSEAKGEFDTGVTYLTRDDADKSALKNNNFIGTIPITGFMYYHPKEEEAAPITGQLP